MPPSVANNTGSTAAKDVPYGPYSSFQWEEFPEWKGAKSVIFRSADGKTVIGSATESGTGSLTYPCSEFFYVTEGWVKVTIHGGEEFTLNKGDCVYIPQGTTVDFVFGDNFQNLAVFMGDKKIDLV